AAWCVSRGYTGETRVVRVNGPPSWVTPLSVVAAETQRPNPPWYPPTTSWFFSAVDASLRPGGLNTTSNHRKNTYINRSRSEFNRKPARDVGQKSSVIDRG